MKFSLLTIFLFFLTFQSEVFAEPEKCKSLDSSKWTNCIGSIALKGEAYVGSFKDGLPHGKGTYTFSDGATYVGEFFNGKESGKGIFNCWVHGASYIGEFKNGKKHGFGTYNYPNGDIYAGYWENGQKHGQGRYMYLNKNIDEGIFENDKFIKKTK